MLIVPDLLADEIQAILREWKITELVAITEELYQGDETAQRLGDLLFLVNSAFRYQVTVDAVPASSRVKPT